MNKKGKNDKDKVKTGIGEYLFNHGCPSDYLGFGILCDLIQEALENFYEMAANLKSIYYAVAKKRNTTRLSIERDLQTLIDIWGKRAPEKFAEFFDKVPTNGEMLHILTRKLRYLNCSVYDTLLMP